MIELGNTRDPDNYLDYVLMGVSCVADEARVRPAFNLQTIFFLSCFFSYTRPVRLNPTGGRRVLRVDAARRDGLVLVCNPVRRPPQSST